MNIDLSAAEELGRQSHFPNWGANDLYCRNDFSTQGLIASFTAARFHVNNGLLLLYALN